MQSLIEEERILAGHDVSAGGLITTMMEMCFANTSGGVEVDISGIPGETIQVMFSEKPGVVIQVSNPFEVTGLFEKEGIQHHLIGRPIEERELQLRTSETVHNLSIDHYRDLWFRSSYLLDRKQSGENLAEERYENYMNHDVKSQFQGFQRHLRKPGYRSWKTH